MPDNDHLSDTEAADVLRRAALLQAQGEHARGTGLSLDEVKHAAEAAGIDARYVEQAYLGAGEDIEPIAPFMGIETGVRRSRVVPGRVSEKEWGQMILALRREFGNDGVAETLGDVREWKFYQTRVQVEPDGPNTRITAVGDWAVDAKAMLYGSLFYLVAAPVIALVGGSQGSVGFAAVLFVLGLLHAGYAWGPVRNRARKRGPQLDRALDALERISGADEREAALATAPPAPEAQPAGAAGEAQMDASLLDAEPVSDARASRQRLRE